MKRLERSFAQYRMHKLLNHFNPNRLALAMRARGVTKRALATRLDCSERLIGYHLNGEKSPDAYVELLITITNIR